MPITHGHSFLVHPGKHEGTQPYIGGANIPRSGKLFNMLSKLFDDSVRECDIDINFRMTEDGIQENECRTDLLAYLGQPSMKTGREIAARLQNVTTKRSGLGLLFVMSGNDNHGMRLLIARFPADEGVIAQEQDRSLDLQFIERVFMKSSKSYKSALYQCSTVHAGFWEGMAADRQIGETRELSTYWIEEFLNSELRTTGAAGTRRFAIALKTAIQRTKEPGVRDELLSAAKLARGQQGRTISMARLARNLGLSNEAVSAITEALPRSELANETFRFSQEEFDAHIGYRSIELDNGATLTAENSAFDDVFIQKSWGIQTVV